MHIAVIAADLFPKRLGGAETHIVEVAKRLTKNGHRFAFFVGPDDHIKNILPKEISVHTVWYPKIPNVYGLSYIAFAPRQIQKKLQTHKIDAIWAKQVFPQAVVGAILAKWLKKPLYITAQNPLAFKEELVIRGPFPFKRQIPNLLTPFVEFALRSAQIVGAVSRYSASQAQKLGAKRTTVIPNGVDLKTFKIKEEKIKKKEERMRIITTSSLIPRNGIDTLIEAVSLLSDTLDWELIIAGDGPEYQHLKAQIAKLELKEKVTMLGRVENRNIPQLLKSADIFVRLSRKEGFGVSFLEAMAAGVPVVATPIGGITDFIENEKTGLLVMPEKPQEAARAIERLLGERKLYTHVQKNARVLVKEKYTWEKIADEVNKVLSSIT